MEQPSGPLAAAAAGFPGRVLLVAAHPDDETVGAAGLLLRLGATGRCTVIHLTDGAPREGRFRAAPFASAPRERYAQVRRAELAGALSRAGLGAGQLLSLGIPDQEAISCLATLTRRLAEVLGALRPTLVVTHPYEGGHPDHDAAAFAVQAAARLLARTRAEPPALVEMTSYHGRQGVLVTSQFLPASGCPVSTSPLSPEEQARKREMLACFESQRETLAPFLAPPSLEVERFRPAPRYDFGAPPHPGPLWYESLGWPVTGEDWRGQARQAIQALGLTEGAWA